MSVTNPLYRYSYYAHATASTARSSPMSGERVGWSDSLSTAEAAGRQAVAVRQTAPILVVLDGPRSAPIASVADYSGTVAGTVSMTSTAHGLATGDRVSITSSTDYDGSYTVTRLDADTFYLAATYTQSRTGTWSGGTIMWDYSTIPASS